MSLGLVHDPIFQEHDPGSFHIETPRRLAVIDQALREWPGMAQTKLIPLRAASEDDLALVHQTSHIHRIASTAGKQVSLDPDTATSPLSYEAACLAVGSLMDLCDAALEGKVTHGAALVRPPGHHATPNRAMGFCLFNNVAVTAAHLLANRGLTRVLIVDWDVHHGNGTEEAFYQEGRVLYFSTHQSPFYPGTGAVNSLGRGPGEGFNINVPLPAGQGDMEYAAIFDRLLLPVAREFKPQFILVSAGYDGHEEDPLGGMRMTDLGYAALSRCLVGLAGDCCPGRLVLTLEGGYEPVAQARAVLACLDALMGDESGEDLRARAAAEAPPRVLQPALEAAGRYWSLA